MKRRQYIAISITFFAFAIAGQAMAQSAAPLSSWRDGNVKKEIIEFVTVVTDRQSKSFVPPSDRLATFDMDGTLVVEKPNAAVVAFSLYYLSEQAKADPALRTPLYMAIRNNDTDYLNQHIYQVLTEAGKGLSVAAYQDQVQAFSATQIHPTLKLPFARTFYTPMIELMEYLKDHDFQVYIVTGSSRSFVRAFAGPVTGLPMGHMIGAGDELSYRNGDFIRTGTYTSFAVEGVGKPEIIEYQIGKKPIFSFGNSDGDIAMFQSTASNAAHRNLSLCLEHDDPERELVAYPSGVDPMKGLVKVSMKRDFGQLFSKAP